MSATLYMREYSCPKKSSIYSDFPLVLAARAISRDYQVTPYDLRSDQLIYPIKSDYIFYIWGALKRLLRIREAIFRIRVGHKLIRVSWKPRLRRT